MNKGLFITGTSTDVGKTYVAALLIKALRDAGHHCCYYKAAASGADSIGESDAGYVNKFAKIGQREEALLSYLYKTPVSPHLAALLEGNPVCMAKIKYDYYTLCAQYDLTVVEGSGGIICPVRWDSESHILLEDIIKMLSLPVLVIANADLGTINATALTVHYLQCKNIPVSGVILNHYSGTTMQADNLEMIQKLTGVSVVATVCEGDSTLNLPAEKIVTFFGR